MKTLTPFGVQDLTPDLAAKHAKLLTQLSGFFDRSGFELVRTPIVEYLDSLKPGMGDTLTESCVKFFDNDGQLLILKPDHTLPIARLVSSQMQANPLPLSLYYHGPVFRKGPRLECMQAGVERIGPQSPEADAKLVMLCLDCLKKLGLTDLVLDIGHNDLSDTLPDDQKKALLERDYIALGALPKRTNGDEVHDHAYLGPFLKDLSTNGVKAHLNYGLVKNIAYYTGLTFEVLSPTLKKVVASGGRYDALLAKFGYDVPAIGFALYLDTIKDGL